MRIRLLAVALLLPFVAACARTESQGAGTAKDTSSMQQKQPTAAPSGAMAPGASTAMTVDLAAKGSSGITGTATLTPAGDSLTVKVHLTGIAQGKSYPTHIHHGSCAQEGAVAVPLNSVQGQADGTGTSTTTIPTSKVPTGPHFIQSHLPDGTPAACGDVTQTGGSM